VQQLMIWIRKVGNKCVQQLCQREYERQVFQGFHERPIELRFDFQRVYIWQVQSLHNSDDRSPTHLRHA
jgi:hypothetical protein